MRAGQWSVEGVPPVGELFCVFGHSTDKSRCPVTCFTEALRAIKQGIAAADDSTLDDAREVGGRHVHLLPCLLAPAGTVEGSTHAANDLFPPQEEALAFQSV